MCLQVSRASSGPLHIASSFTLVYNRLHRHTQTHNQPDPAKLKNKTKKNLSVRSASSLEVFRVLGESHLYDIESIVVVFLGREKQGQQVKGVDVISLKLQCLSNIA